MKSVLGRVKENRKVARNTFRMRLAVPRIPGTVDAGQFVHLRLNPTLWDPMLRRPFSIMDVSEGPAGIESFEILYLRQGRGSRMMAEMPVGEEVGVLGPLGHGYDVRPGVARHVLVGGGVGVPPLYLLALQLVKRHGVPPSQVLALIGARSADLLACLEDFWALGIGLRVSTDDGTAHEKGRVTDLMKSSCRPGDALYTCGPEGMLHAVLGLSRELKLPCQLSLERNMGCGLGACKSCVCEVRVPAGAPKKYRTVCREGPVFDAEVLP